MRFFRIEFLATTILSAGGSLAQADVKVVTSIKPIHSLVSAVMAGGGEPSLLVKGAGSRHTYSLRPSQAKQLQEADLVFWMGHDLEAFLENSIESIATNAKSVPLMEAHGLTKLEFREGGAFEDHADHDDHKKDEHGHDDLAGVGADQVREGDALGHARLGQVEDLVDDRLHLVAHLVLL